MDFKFTVFGDCWEIKEINNSEMNMMCGSDLKDSFTHGTTEYSENIIYINKDSPIMKRTLYHELMHCFLYEFGHNPWEKEFNAEDVCEISACSHDMIHEIVKKYFNAGD